MAETPLRIAALTALLLATAGPAQAITEVELIAHARKGEPASLLIQRIEADRTVFRIGDKDIERLLEAGLPRDVIMFMRETPARFSAPSEDEPPAGEAPAPSAEARTSVAELVKLVKSGSSDAAIVTKLAHLPPLVELTSRDADRLHEAGASPALLRYLLAKSERDQPLALGPPTAPTRRAAAERRASAATSKSPAAPPSESFTDSGNLIFSGGFAVDRKVPKDGSSSTELILTPSLGIFVANGFLLEAGLAFAVREGSDGFGIRFAPGYYAKLGGGTLALFGQAVLGFEKSGSLKAPAGGFRVGLAIAPGKDVGPLIRIGPTLLWTKVTTQSEFLDESISSKARVMTFGTDIGLWF
ncbi:MAG: hypothetical protein H6746_06660 [Deltaproteobacteria bacterium]|nr:hypothetical protein [Deltaproteobacteria bacterium]